ncbi:hypothetical protein EDE05_101144 [Neorhizobium sp. R1-B]|nr:hypothetical protein EDE09_101466 [Neorhizobium sp. S3-V5DH]TDX88834.1 hypothetical protein EDE05_101144 [Neorhizobium sp. R1-B]
MAKMVVVSTDLKYISMYRRRLLANSANPSPEAERTEMLLETHLFRGFPT